MIVHMIGNAHLDPVWLWNWQAGADEVMATFGSAADRCDEYPEFIFTAGESWRYRIVEDLDPGLFKRIKDLVAAGRWCPTGGQHIQPDTNMPTATAWRRQFAEGLGYFQDRFGVRPTIGYNVDSFGHPASLPDLLSDNGFRGYVFHRPNHSQVALPAQTFRWRGASGGEVVGSRINPVYVSHSTDLLGYVLLSVEAANPGIDQVMCFYGVGNHGGGPTKRQIEWILGNRNPLPGVELRFSSPEAFFDAIEPRRAELPEVTTELQHVFPGCYSVMHDIKSAQRHVEHRLEQADRVVELWAHRDDATSMRTRLTSAWQDALFTEFHDILSGTSIHDAWPSVRATQGRARIEAEEVVYRCTRRWAREQLPPINDVQVVALNPDQAEWSGLVETEPWLDFDQWGQRWLSDQAGNPIDFQLVQSNSAVFTSRVIFPAVIPAGGAHHVRVRDPAMTRAPVSTDLQASPRRLANSVLSLDVGCTGITGIASGNTDLLGSAGWSLHLRAENSDTWTMSTDRFIEPVSSRLDNLTWTIQEEGPLRARLCGVGLIGRSHVRWTVSLEREVAAIDLELEVTFAEAHTALQMPIVLATKPLRWTDGLAGGQVDRAPDETEWPVQGWSRVRTAGRDLAIVTPDAYSLSLNRDAWQWTLLRSPRMAFVDNWAHPDPDNPGLRSDHGWITDQGEHSFRFRLLVGDCLQTDTLHRVARQQGQPVITFDRYEGLDRPPWGDHPPPAFEMGGEQRARRYLAEQQAGRG